MESGVQTILVVDDIELNRCILSELFKDRYQILEAENGRQALEIVKARGGDVGIMLLDLMMPVMNGIEVLREMKRAGWIETIPVVLITAESDEDTFLKGYTMGVSDIINKPFNPDIVRKRVENIVELYQHKHHLEERVHRQMAALESQADQLRKINAILEAQAQELKRTNSFVLDSLSTVVEFRNGESGQHIKRIRDITRVLMQALSDRYAQYRMSAETIDVISDASAMHDIGKIAIPDAVLLKPGRLTDEEFEIMKTHTLRGCELLESLGFGRDQAYYDYCYEICRHHHERWDGRGYPDGLKGGEIPIWAQVVSIADVYDALISERVYKRAYSHETAVKMIAQGECGVFNPSLMQCFLQVADALRPGGEGARIAL